jgi:hypothetical protein
MQPDLLNSRFGYVSISRASHEATLFTDDLSKLNSQLSTDVSKSSALEFGQTASLSQALGLRCLTIPSGGARRPKFSTFFTYLS